MKFHYLIVISVISSFCTHAQSPYILRGDQAYHTYDRAEILRLSDTTLINGINNYDRNLTVDFFKNIWQNDELTKKDRYDLLHIYSDNFEFLDAQDSIVVPDSQNEVIFREGTNESQRSFLDYTESWIKNMAPYQDRGFGKIIIPELYPNLKGTTILMPELMLVLIL
jgi:hypothetical protein